MTTISLRATRSFLSSDVSLSGATLVTQGASNTYTITDYNSFSIYSVSSTVGTATISGDSITLNIPTTTASQVTLRVFKGTSASSGTTSEFVIAVGATAIVTPNIISPIANAVGVNLAPTISATQFTTAPTGADVQQSAQWQISTNVGFTTVVYDSGVSTSSLTSVTVPAGTLALNTQYYVRVRFTGATLGTSAWSSVISFTTSNQYVATPTLTMSDNVNSVSETPTLSGTAFSVVNGSDVHSASDWQIVRLSDNVVIWSSIGNTVNKTSIKLPAGLLAVSTQYRARLRYSGANLGYGGWAELNFTTADKFSYGEYLLVEGVGYRNGTLVTNTTPGLMIFGRELDTYKQLVNQPDQPVYTSPNDATVGTSASVSAGNEAFRPDGGYVVVAGGARGLIAPSRAATVFKRVGDLFTRLSPAIVPDSASVNCAKWINNEILLVGSGQNLHVYLQQGDSFVKLPNAPTGYSGQYNNISQLFVHPSGQYVVGLITNANIYSQSAMILWKINGSGVNTTFTNLGRTTNIGGTMGFMSWNPAGTRLAVVGTGTNSEAKIYSFVNEAFSVVATPSWSGFGIAYDTTGNYVATTYSDGLYVYKRVQNTENFSLLRILYSDDNGSSSWAYRRGVKFTPDGRLLIAAVGENEEAGVNKQRLLAFDCTTDDYNPVPAFDVIMQNSTQRVLTWPAVPGQM